jgi:Ca-activated chloride channel homolog
MASKRFPVVVLVVVLAGVVFQLNRHKRASSDAPDPHEDSAAPAVDASYALTVQRTVWPPLVDDGAAASAVSTINYYAVLDGSGSMLSKECGDGSTKIKAALDAVRNFFDSVPADANIGLAAFDRRVIAERVPLGIGNRPALAQALQEIRAGSDTPLRSAMQIGYDKLTAQARAQLGYGEYHLVVVTDGQPDPDSEDPTPLVDEILAKSPVVLHTVGFCIDNNHVLNQANRTYYASATDPEQLRAGLQSVLAEAPVFDAAHFNN